MWGKYIFLTFNIGSEAFVCIKITFHTERTLLQFTAELGASRTQLTPLSWLTPLTKTEIEKKEQLIGPLRLLYGLFLSLMPRLPPLWVGSPWNLQSIKKLYCVQPLNATSLAETNAGFLGTIQSPWRLQIVFSFYRQMKTNTSSFYRLTFVAG